MTPPSECRPGGTQPETIHATAVAINGQGVLLCGRSGAGKSDLALRLIDRGAALVSDDYTVVEQAGAAVRASAPAAIAGKIEVRGLGIVAVPHTRWAPVALAIALGEPVDRMPRPETMMIAGVAIPLLRLSAFEASAPIKVETALRQLATGAT